MTVRFFSLTPWQAAIRSVGILNASFSKMATSFFSKASASTSPGMPTISRYSCLEYSAFNQQWRFIFTRLLDRRVLTSFVTDSSASNLKKRHSTYASLPAHCYSLPQFYSEEIALLEWGPSCWNPVTTRLCKLSCFSIVVIKMKIPVTK